MLSAGGVSTVRRRPPSARHIIGVGYIIGPELAALNFSGSVVAWGLLIPLLIFFLGPQLQTFLPPARTDEDWLGLANAVWRYIVRPIAVGSMMVGTCYTLFRMRKNLIAGLGKAFAELKVPAPAPEDGGPHRTLHEFENGLRADRRDFLLMCVLYIYMSG